MPDPRRTTLVWIFISLLSATLFVVGIILPARTAAQVRDLEERTRLAGSPWEAKELAERVDALRGRATPNYYTGIAIPIGLLGVGAVVTTPRTRRGNLPQRAPEDAAHAPGRWFAWRRDQRK